jgi:hypothetical protein
MMAHDRSDMGCERMKVGSTGWLEGRDGQRHSNKIRFGQVNVQEIRRQGAEKT